MVLLFSARTFGDVLFRDELLALDARRDGFNLALALTREPVRRADDYGRRVDTAMLTELLAKLPERHSRCSSAVPIPLSRRQPTPRSPPGSLQV
jgi:hypothetical protein